MENSPIVISNYSNVSLDFKLPDIIRILGKKFDKKSCLEVYNFLN